MTDANDLIDRLLAFAATLANEEEDMVNEAATHIAALTQANQELQEQLEESRKSGQQAADSYQDLGATTFKEIERLERQLQEAVEVLTQTQNYLYREGCSVQDETRGGACLEAINAVLASIQGEKK